MKSHFNSIERILELQETKTWEASWEVKEESKVEGNIFSIYISGELNPTESAARHWQFVLDVEQLRQKPTSYSCSRTTLVLQPKITSYRSTHRSRRQKLVNLAEKTSDLADFGNIQLPEIHPRFLYVLTVGGSRIIWAD